LAQWHKLGAESHNWKFVVVAMSWLLMEQRMLTFFFDKNLSSTSSQAVGCGFLLLKLEPYSVSLKAAAVVLIS